MYDVVTYRTYATLLLLFAFWGAHPQPTADIICGRHLTISRYNSTTDLHGRTNTLVVGGKAVRLTEGGPFLHRMNIFPWGEEEDAGGKTDIIREKRRSGSPLSHISDPIDQGEIKVGCVSRTFSYGTVG